jgi:hypothetical protein
MQGAWCREPVLVAINQHTVLGSHYWEIFKSFFIYFIFIYIFAPAERRNGLKAQRLNGRN